jgi:ABC-type sulfate/molybdate transport systems ATPase subunit
VTALADIDLEIPRGELVSIVGPSGSGKSTLLNLIGGLDPAIGSIPGRNWLHSHRWSHCGERMHPCGWLVLTRLCRSDGLR